jgi:predicted DNA-binding protein
MTIQLSPDLECRLAAVAAQRAVPVSEVVSEIVTRYLEHLPDDPLAWVQGTTQGLKVVWPAEDYSELKRPQGGYPVRL